jgi:ribosomal protein S18 acetylase RimI-like enzyme
VNRVVAFSRRFDEGLVEEIVPAPHGRVLLTPSLSRVFYLNHFSVDLGADVSAEQIVEELEPIFASRGLLHRKVTVDDELGAKLAPDFRRLGWRIEELLVMPHATSVPDLDTSLVEEVSPEEMEPIWEAGIRSDPEITDDEEVRQLVAGQHRRREAIDVRYFAARAEGDLVSYCELFTAEGTGQIESVMTREPFRGRGYAKAVVTRALAESHAAGNDFTFLVATADDWPKELYRKLGFEEAGRLWDFLLREAR